MSILNMQKPNLLRHAQAAAMFGGFSLLLCEIRFEHRAVLLEDWRPWVPIAICGLMLVVIPVVSWLASIGARRTLMGCYVLTMCLGVFGLIVHSDGHLFERLNELVSVWTSSLQAGAEIKAHHPPLLAPAAFTGLGLIGLLFCVNEKVRTD